MRCSGASSSLAGSRCVWAVSDRKRTLHGDAAIDSPKRTKPDETDASGSRRSAHRIPGGVPHLGLRSNPRARAAVLAFERLADEVHDIGELALVLELDLDFAVPPQSPPGHVDGDAARIDEIAEPHVEH